MTIKGITGFKRFFPLEIDTTSQSQPADPLSPYYSKLTHSVTTIIVAQDGSEDYESIQDGINALPPEGGIVFVKAGTYNLSSKISISKNSVHIEGIGINTVIQPAAILDSCFYVATGVLNFKISAVKFKSPYLMNNAIIELASGTSYTRLQNVTFESWQGCAIKATSAINMIISECIFITPLNDTTAAINILSSSTHCIVTNNIFSMGVYSYGIIIQGNSSYITITSNSFKTGYIAISLYGNTAVNYCVITGNVMEQIGYGITLDGVTHTTVTGNSIGITTPRIIVGIYVKLSNYCTITGNSLYRTYWGIYLYPGKGGTGNTIVGNTIENIIWGYIMDGGMGTEIGHNPIG